MRLLVTNDDGIESFFLHELVRALIRAGHSVAVVAPLREQSWIGAAKSRHRPVTSTTADRGLGCPTWVVDGTPSDCVNIGLAHLLPRGPKGEAVLGPDPAQPFDGVVSGINTGRNASIAFIIASGTIGGAWEGALHGLPAIAFSQDMTPEVYEAFKQAGRRPAPALAEIVRVSADHAARLTPELIQATHRRFLVHNVNFPYPCRPGTEVRTTVPAQVIIPGLFSPLQDDGTHRFVFSLGEDFSPPEPLTDRACLAAGHISHTVLDYTKLGRL